MGNRLPDNMVLGTLGEVFSQLRLLELGIQAAPPIKDSGNDLIAIKGEVVKYIQVKTSATKIERVNNLPGIYHLVFLVEFESDESGIKYDDSKIWVINKDESVSEKKELTQELVDSIWQ